MNIEHTSNMKSVEEFVTFIRERIQRSNKNWWEIAQAFAEAKEMYGAGSDHFNSLCLKTSFSKSKALKLALIAVSDRLRQYAEKLSAVHSWNTLYAIASLKEDKFEELVKTYKLDSDASVVPFITLEAVERIRKGKQEPAFLKNYAVIQLDEDALKGGLITDKDCDELYKLIAQIDNLTSYIRVKRTEIDEKNTVQWLNRIEDKVKQIARKKYNEALDAMLSRHKKPTNATMAAHELQCFGKSRQEMLQDFNINPEEAFKYVGIEYDYPAYHRQAESEVADSMDKYAAKAMNRPKVEPLPLPLSDEESWELVKQDSERMNRTKRYNKSAFANFK